ncbi:Uncharacterised protein [Klebsiella quasipneumoniae]|uniref:hypothetical protein n=1 Tax=Klebsiella quasipneumoniae TaxID=1463165 RepID=UPI0009BBBA0F|nr:hypothetical protein [Klebsiella quasipneumoniae]MDZ1776440.1 hypothetical protein [Klebsiella quasipneumoniae]SLQ74646.1 Uncharacterised protein [Klebsiella quasipneumoniae]
MKKIIGTFTLLAFCITVFFASREWMALLVIIPLTLLCLSGIEKLGAIPCFIGVIVVCAVSILWINSITPLWGERYTERQGYEKVKEDLREQETQEIRKISIAQVAVKGLLKDPYSADFSGEKVNSNSVVCGYVNAKNSLGAYSGKDRYIFNGAAYIDDGSGDFASMWASLCK